MTVQPLKPRRGSTRKTIAWAIVVLMLAVPCINGVAAPGDARLGEQARRAIGQWPAAQQADQGWEWVRILVFLVQIALSTQGFDPGKPDGLMGPNTMMALLAWRSEKGEPRAIGRSPSWGIADIVAQLLHVTLETMGLSPGPRDQVLGRESTAALERWDGTFIWGAISMDIGAPDVARKMVMENFGQSPSSDVEKPATAPQAATPPGPATRDPARGELWAAYTGYSFDRYQGDEGYGLAWNYPSKEEAIAEARNECKRRQPPFPSFDHKRCGDDTWATSTTATPEVMIVEVPSERWRGFIRTWVNNAQCFAIVKQVTLLATVHIEVVLGNSEKEAVYWAEQRFDDDSRYEIEKVVCNDW